MAIVSVRHFLSWNHSSTARSFSANGPYTIDVSRNEFLVLIVATENADASEGNTNLHASVSGGNGIWTKLYEWQNGQSGSNQGVAVSAWLFVATGSNPSGVTVKVDLATALVDKVMTAWCFSKGAGTTIEIDPSAAPVGTSVDGATSVGLAAFSGLPAAERLFIRGVGREANTTGNLSASSGFSLFTSSRSRNDPSAINVAGEFAIQSGAGAESSPTSTVSADMAALFIALIERQPEVVNGDLKVWDGAGWIGKPIKIWTGSSWAAKPMKRWNGTDWVQVS